MKDDKQLNGYYKSVHSTPKWMRKLAGLTPDNRKDCTEELDAD